MTFSARFELYQHFRAKKEYDKMLPLIEKGLTCADTPNDTKAEWFCDRLMIFVLQQNLSSEEIINEFKKLESMNYEDPRSCYQRIHYFASDLWDLDHQEQALALMKWLKEERYRKEYGIMLLNNYAFMLSRIGKEEESEKVRMELIESHYDDPGVVSQMFILIHRYDRENSPESREKIREWSHKILDHPKATAEDKEKAESYLELVQRLELGIPSVDDFEGQPDIDGSLAIQRPQKHLMIRSFFILIGLGMFLGAIYFKLRARRNGETE